MICAEEKNPCSLCAKLRRGASTPPDRSGLHKIALGHHFDDAVETFLLYLCLRAVSAASSR